MEKNREKEVKGTRYNGVDVDVADDEKVTPAEVRQETRELNDNPRDNSLDE